MWWWVLGGTVVIAIVGGAISTHYEDKLWEEFFRKVWNRITGRGKSKKIKSKEQDPAATLADKVNAKSNPPA